MTIRVLIVDDDVPTRVGLNTILAAEPDIEIVGEAADGVQACALAASLDPDIVLMDVQLPDLDGIEATRRILDQADPVPRVIMLTTFEFDEYLYRSLRAGASGFLLKRTRAEELVEAVRVVASGEALPVPEKMQRLIAQFAKGEAANPYDWKTLDSLTERESQVLVLVARGLSNREIADELSLSIETVKTHLKHVYVKLRTRDRAQAVIAAYETGLVSRRPD